MCVLCGVILVGLRNGTLTGALEPSRTEQQCVICVKNSRQEVEMAARSTFGQLAKAQKDLDEAREFIYIFNVVKATKRVFVFFF